ncbi:nucleotide sugar dehydrogenase [Puteibacter caeruleilacunae]|nr:nucleotide sugar dehydrogenase [Puteibacter caeruleilacunae]
MVLDLLSNKANLGVVGLGYVGLPIALEFASLVNVKGFDISKEKVEAMKKGVDPSGELDRNEFENKRISFSAELDQLEDVRFYVVAVPTPVSADYKPDLSPLKSATKMVARYLKEGDYVVFESTVYPGCTEEVCVPILEEISGLKVNEDFKVGYSPERINPGDKKNTISTITKVVSGSDQEAAEAIADVYDLIIEAGVHVAPNMKTAEACKVVENTQRDVNIALMNELSNMFEKMGINTNDVIAATATKWNALPFFPGLVGGHCIGVDPYYLAHKANALGVGADLILTSRHINEELPSRIAGRIAEALKKHDKKIYNCRILVRGITFKENVSDIRNSKVGLLYSALKDMGAEVVIEDPLADPKEVEDEYGIRLSNAVNMLKYDAVVVAVAHTQFKFHDAEYYQRISKDTPVIFDLRGIVEGGDQLEDYYTL